MNTVYERRISMQQEQQIYAITSEKNKPATASFVLSIVSISFLVLTIPLIIVGGMLMSMAGQSPEASGVDMDDPTAIEEYYRESRILGITGAIVFFTPPVLTGITGLLGLIFGIIGSKNPYKRKKAIAGIVISAIPICIGTVFLLFEFLS